MIRHFRRLSALVLALMLLVPAAGAQESALNILLIGVDTIREEQSGRSDVMMLVRADPQNGEIRMVSFLRDLYVSIPTVGKTRLNAAYFHGGEALLKQTLEENFGISIDRTVTVHFSLLADLVDQLGGIEVEIAQRELNHLNKLIKDYNDSYGLAGDALEAPGLQRLNGKQALCYSRIRKIDSDFQRTSRQQAVIAAMLKQASMLNPWQLMKLAVGNLPRIKTDMGLGDIAALLPLAAQISDAPLETARVPFDGAFKEETISGMMVLTPDLAKCRSLLQDFLD